MAGAPRCVRFRALSRAVLVLRSLAQRLREMPLVLIVILLVLALGPVPACAQSRDWGYYPSSAVTAAGLILVALVLTGRL